MNLIIEKDGKVLLTDSQFAAFDNVTVHKGAVLVTVPDSSTLEEREQFWKTT